MGTSVSPWSEGLKMDSRSRAALMARLAGQADGGAGLMVGRCRLTLSHPS